VNEGSKFSEEDVRELFDRLPEPMRVELLDTCARALSDTGLENPPLDLVQATALDVFRKKLEDSGAYAMEYLTEDMLQLYCVEEERRLASEYPEGIPEDVLTKAVAMRFYKDYPDLFRWDRRSSPE
jgi:hypothetical protein